MGVLQRERECVCACVTHKTCKRRWTHNPTTARKQSTATHSCTSSNIECALPKQEHSQGQPLRLDDWANAQISNICFTEMITIFSRDLSLWLREIQNMITAHNKSGKKLHVGAALICQNYFFLFLKRNEDRATKFGWYHFFKSDSVLKKSITVKKIENFSSRDLFVRLKLIFLRFCWSCQKKGTPTNNPFKVVSVGTRIDRFL